MKYIKLVAGNVHGLNALCIELKRARYTVLHTHTEAGVTVLVLHTLRSGYETARGLVLDYSTYCRPEHLTDIEFAQLQSMIR